MDTDDSVLIKRFSQLHTRAFSQNTYIYTDFLTASEQDILLSSVSHGVSLYGGFCNSERNIAVFGSEDEFGYKAEPPVVCIKASPLNKRFSDELSHRDVLGALMTLGIKREVVGDIFINDNGAYIFCLERLAEFIKENLTRIKHTSISCEITSELPENIGGTLQKISLIIASPRLDAVVGGIFKLSRSSAAALVSSKKVFINGKLTENTSYNLKENDTVSVRGYGKFKWQGVFGETKKGRAKAEALIYK